MFTPQSAPRHRAATRKSFVSSPLARSPLVSSWRAPPSASRPLQQSASLAGVYSVESSSHCNAKLLRSSLPAAVADLTQSHDAKEVRLHSTGWAWMVTRQHQLYLWRYDPAAGTQTSSRTPRAITLPSSPVPYTSAQVCVFSVSPSEDLWCVVAVSAQGHVRCWSQWPKSSSCSDIQIDVAPGDSCSSVVECMPHGCVIATAKGDIFLLGMSSEPSSSLTWRSLHKRSGALADLKRRVSSLFFISAEENRFTLTGMACNQSSSDDMDREVAVLGETSVEKWRFSHSGEKMTSSVDLNSLPVKEAIAEQLVEAYPGSNVSFDGLHVQACDVLLDDQTVVVLAAVSDKSTVASSVKPDELFLLGFSLPEHSDETVLFARKISQNNFDALRPLASWHPLLVRLASSTSFDVALSSLFCDRQMESGSAATRTLEIMQTLFGSEQIGDGDSRLLVMLANRPTLPAPDVTQQSARTVAETSSATSALTAVSSPLPSSLTPIPLSGTTANSSVVGAMAGNDRYMQLRNAFITFCQPDSRGQCLAVCQNLFPTTTPELDQMLVQLSRELINDRGASDPRWAERNAMAADPMSTAALLSAQHDLQNTQDVHNRFLEFVISMEWWDKLGVVDNRGHVLPTELLLGEHSEMVAAASTLVSLHCKHPGVLDRAVDNALARRGSTSSNTTSPHHQFYHQVECISDILASLVACIQQQLSSTPAGGGSGANNDQHIDLFLTVNTIVESFLSAAAQRRQKTFAIVFSPSVLHRPGQTEYLPWTASSGDAGSRASLLRLFTLIAERAIPSANHTAVQQDLFTQLGRLADNILDGFRMQLRSAKSINVDAVRMEELQGDMETSRRQIIQPFLDHNQREKARQLAEHYGDFAALIQLSESAGEDDQLMSYMCKFAEEGFAEYVFKYYLDQGRLAKLLSQPPALHQKLANFLKPHSKLRWLHCLEQGDFRTAQTTLHDLADDETVYLSKKKTLLSLAKLACLASDDGGGDAVTVQPDDEYFKSLCRQQELITLQETMPQHITEELKLDFQTMRPLLPTELVDTLTGTSNPDAEPADFIRALEVVKLAPYDTDEEFVSRCSYIWSQALLRDQAFWQSVEESERRDSVANTFLCRTIRTAAQQSDLPLGQFLTDPQLLLQSELLSPLQLHERPAVVFWLRAAYDHVIQQQASNHGSQA